MNADQIIDQIQDLYPPPKVACKLLNLLKRSDQDIQEVVQTLQSDAVLTAKILKTCNSAMMGGRDALASIEQAVIRLGYKEVLRIVLAFSVGGSLSKKLDAYGVAAKDLWHHSLTTGIMAQRLNEWCGDRKQEASVVFTAGILHDFGKVVLDQSMLPEVEKIRELVEKNQLSLIEAEKSVMTVDHTEIGARLMKRWKLPPMLVEAVRFHHDPLSASEEFRPIAALIHVSNCNAHAMGSSFGWESLATRFQEEAANVLGLKSEHMEKAMIAILGDSDKIKALVSINE
jgi:putative nucleotidyltransferase with HDIG domain